MMSENAARHRPCKGRGWGSHTRGVHRMPGKEETTQEGNGVRTVLKNIL